MKAYGFGRLVAKPVVRPVGETKVAEITIAVDEFRKVNGERKKHTSFINFEVWDSAADVFAKRDKGDVVNFTATVRQNKWVDEKSGENRSKIVFRMDDFSFIFPPKKQEEQTSTTVEKQEVEEEVPF